MGKNVWCTVVWLFFWVGLCLGDRRYDDMYTHNIYICIYTPSLRLTSYLQIDAWKTILLLPFWGKHSNVKVNFGWF